uniref:Uncharacterized protein n=1 Tax=Noccaea caerulescens TaxID=107243 RepID=A0A1J3GX01_NOCCA
MFEIQLSRAVAERRFEKKVMKLAKTSWDHGHCKSGLLRKEESRGSDETSKYQLGPWSLGFQRYLALSQKRRMLEVSDQVGQEPDPSKRTRS